MGVDITKEIITGALYSWDDLGRDYIDKYFTEDYERFGEKINIIQLNPYGTENSLPDFILGIVDQTLDGSGDRATEEDRVSIKEIETNEESKKLIEATIREHNLPEKEIKAYEIIYFT